MIMVNRSALLVGLLASLLLMQAGEGLGTSHREIA